MSFSHFPSLYPLTVMPVQSQYDWTFEGVEKPGFGVFILWDFTSLFDDLPSCQDICRLGLFPAIQMLELPVN